MDSLQLVMAIATGVMAIATCFMVLFNKRLWQTNENLRQLMLMGKRPEPHYLGSFAGVWNKGRGPLKGYPGYTLELRLHLANDGEVPIYPQRLKIISNEYADLLLSDDTEHAYTFKDMIDPHRVKTLESTFRFRPDVDQKQVDCVNGHPLEICLEFKSGGQLLALSL